MTCDTTFRGPRSKGFSVHLGPQKQGINLCGLVGLRMLLHDDLSGLDSVRSGFWGCEAKLVFRYGNVFNKTVDEYYLPNLCVWRHLNPSMVSTDTISSLFCRKITSNFGWCWAFSQATFNLCIPIFSRCLRVFHQGLQLPAACFVVSHLRYCEFPFSYVDRRSGWKGWLGNSSFNSFCLDIRIRC